MISKNNMTPILIGLVYFVILGCLLYFDIATVKEFLILLAVGLGYLFMSLSFGDNLVDTTLGRLQNDEEFYAKIRSGLKMIITFIVGMITIVPATIYILVTSIFPIFWKQLYPNNQVPSGIAADAWPLCWNIIQFVLFEIPAHVITTLFKNVGGVNMILTEVPVHSPTVFIIVITGVCFTWWTHTVLASWDNRWIKNAVGRFLVIDLLVPALIIVITFKAGVWEKTAVPIQKNNAAIALYYMVMHKWPAELIDGTTTSAKSSATKPLQETENIPLSYDDEQSSINSPPASKKQKSGGWLWWIVGLLFLAGGVFLFAKKKQGFPGRGNQWHKPSSRWFVWLMPLKGRLAWLMSKLFKNQKQQSQPLTEDERSPFDQYDYDRPDSDSPFDQYDYDRPDSDSPFFGEEEQVTETDHEQSIRDLIEIVELYLDTGFHSERNTANYISYINEIVQTLDSENPLTKKLVTLSDRLAELA